MNTGSRRGRSWYASARACLEQSGVEIVRTIATRDPEEVMRATEDVVRAGVPLVAVGGGDGTLSAIARYFVGSESVLGVLPLGTGNQFARDLGIEADVESACRVIVDGEVAAVDVGTIGDDYFLNVATVGLTTRIAQSLSGEKKRKLGRLVYLIALARALRHVKPFEVTLQTDDGVSRYRTLQVVVGNGRFHAGPFLLAPEARITDGKLVVYVLDTVSRLGLLKFALNLPGGRHVHLDEVPTFWTTRGHIETRPVEPVTVDGEIEMHTPIDFGIAPGALRVMVPRHFEKQPG